MTLPSTASVSYPEDQYSYFGAGYVKFLEMAGIRVIAIPYDLDPVEIEKLFSQINGILLPGGGSSLWVDEEKMLGFSNMTLTSKFLFELAIKANMNEDYFPIWGTCLGLEMLLLDVSSDSKILDKFNSENHHGNLLILNEKSRVFEGITEEMKLYTETGSPAFFFHKYGKRYDKFVLDERLMNFFEINIVMEKRENVNHERESIIFSQHLANFIGREVRKNNHRFMSEEEEEKYLIYNYNPVRVDNFYEQVYFFKNRK